MAYRQYTWFTHGYVGRKQRRVIPSCVVSKIKQLYQKPMQMRTGALRKQLDMMMMMMMMMIMLLGLVDVHIIIGTCACRKQLTDTIYNYS